MDPYVGEIRIFSGDFAPNKWALCDGSLIAISQNTALFAILGTTYGGDGKTTFALPNLNARAAMHHGKGPGLSFRQLGEPTGSDTVTLIESQMPAHHHMARSQLAGNETVPEGANWSAVAGRVPNIYGSTPDMTMHPLAIQATGGSQPHNNRQPYLGLNFIISLYGIFPPHP
ncbi:phage tail protein [Paenibacillus sp. IB182496]|uniref:Phage tail protein n=1 Tax=Paenibacillus sabuli TaxID=2772509 RepID=A0A927GQ78_9BACL|nr:tail fiber protein [Paenibacillus sabuli]MBD2843600.1 phage tail protein [Paenibacillus sabuli]